MSDCLKPYGLYPTRLPCPWDSPGKNTGVGCRALLQGIFPTQGSNLCLLTSPVLAGRFFTTSTTWEAWDIIISCNRLHGLKKNRNLFSYSSGGWTYKIKVLEGLVSGEVFLPGLQAATCSLGLHTAFPLYMWAPRVSSSSCKDSISSPLGACPFYLTCPELLLKALSPNVVTLEAEPLCLDFVGRGTDTTQSITITFPKAEKNLNSKDI